MAAERLVALGMPPALAKEVVGLLTGGVAFDTAVVTSLGKTNAKAAVNAAVAAKAEVAALTSQSDAEDIVNALQA